MYRIGLLSLLIFYSCKPSVSSKSNKESQSASQVIDKALFLSSITFQDLTGEILDPKIYSDKIMILNLWATWCGPCIREMPDLVEMQKKLSDEFVLLLASDEESEKVKRFVDGNSFELKFIQIDQSIESLGVYSLPTTFIVGKDGELLETLVGARDWDSPKEIQNLQKYLK